MFEHLRRKQNRSPIDPTRTQVREIGNSRVEVGRFTYGADGLTIRQWREGANLTIGSFCSLADGINVFLGGNHRTDWMTTFPFGHIFRDHLGDAPHPGHPATGGDVNIGSDVWIGQRATILSGVTIGHGAVIGTGAIVGKDVSPYAIFAGNPAKLVRFRFDPAIIDRMLTLRWWDLPTPTIRRIAPLLSAAPDIPTLDTLIADRDSGSLINR